MHTYTTSTTDICLLTRDLPVNSNIMDHGRRNQILLLHVIYYKVCRNTKGIIFWLMGKPDAFLFLLCPRLFIFKYNLNVCGFKKSAFQDICTQACFQVPLRNLCRERSA